ncbi:MAG TPA: MarR family transcriptional regulator [Bacteroidia bacterium]|nr:MarR family transcriptional regulator [Bacteroidia bacterium]
MTLSTALSIAGRIARTYRISKRSLSAVHLLAHLAEQHGRGTPINEAASALGVTPSAITLLADALEDKGLAERRRPPADRRVITLHITAAGLVALSS